MEFRLPFPGIDNDRQFRSSNVQMPPAQDIGNDDLMRRLCAGDEEAFTIVFRRWQGPLFRFALHMSGSRTLAEDATQEVFMTLIRQTAQFDPARGSLGAFLFGIARNQVLKRLERERPYTSLPQDWDEAQVSRPDSGMNASLTAHLQSADIAQREVSARAEAINQVRQAILTLPPDYREVVALCDLEELSYDQAAAILSCTTGTVASRLHRGRALLAEKLRKSRASRAAQNVTGIRDAKLSIAVGDHSFSSVPRPAASAGIAREATNLLIPESFNRQVQKAPK
jgi:RNA polymerase sigma-70 factor, ECF subfamily